MLRPFRIEHYYERWEFAARYMLSSSDAESRTVADLLALEPDARERLDAIWLGYTESPGSPALRATIADLYESIESDDVLVASAAEEAILVAYLALLEPGAHVIVETPCYESALELPRGLGAEVSPWRRRFADGWAHDLDELERLLRPTTRAIYVNTPSNPTGRSMPADVYAAIHDLTRERGITLLCDEVYRESEHDPSARRTAACDVSPTAVSIGSISKTYGLPGLRLGWLATHDGELRARMLARKHYTTICAGAPAEFLVDLALRHRHVLIERTLGIVRANLPLLDGLIARHPDTFAWVRPDASTIGFPRMTVPEGVDAFCARLAEQRSVVLLPGSVYDEPDHVRLGYGRADLPAAVELLDAELADR